jgi:hypothetical protein
MIAKSSIKLMITSVASRWEIFTGTADLFQETRPVYERRVGVAAHEIFR